VSEYQYYEFLAIDRPLTAKEMAHLRAASSRAQITPVSFINEYRWGNLKADPPEWMRRFFDIHVYLANWGEAVLMVRLPKGVIEGEVLDQFAAGNSFEVASLPEHWLVTWSLCDSEDYDRFGYTEGEGWMGRLAPLREELLRGDLRTLYIGWLGSVTTGEVEEDEEEPTVPAGLGELTAAQQALVEYLDVDVDLLAGAASGSPRIEPEESEDAGLDAWLDALPREEVREYLRHMLAGRGAQAERALKRRHAAWHTAKPAARPTERRTVTELWKLAEQAEEARLAEEAETRRQAEEVRKKQRTIFLLALADNLPRGWREANAEANKGTATGYDAACRKLVDLRDAYGLRGDAGSFQRELKRFTAEHGRRRALMDRLTKAALSSRS